jgi:Fe-Mn family superoxide dismutase
MTWHVAPLPCKPWSLNGLSEGLIVSHYENHYGPAVRSLNAVREALAGLDLAAAPAYQVLALKREELTALGSVALHELYFSSLGGDGTAVFTGSGTGGGVPADLSAALERQFGSVGAWRRDFTAAARALRGGPGWVLLNYVRCDGSLSNQIAVDHTQVMIGAVPVLALDLYEHAYQMDFGANAAAYVDTFMRNIDWAAVGGRLAEANGDGRARRTAASDNPLPSVAVEELAAEISKGERIQVLDARPKHYFSRSADMMRGATWRDPDRVDEWSHELSSDAPVFVYCAYGYNVGCGVAAALRARGFDAKFVRGGLAAWYAAGGERTLTPQSNA